jgi:hypothetical protein
MITSNLFEITSKVGAMCGGRIIAYMRFEVFRAVKIHTLFFWFKTP